MGKSTIEQSTLTMNSQWYFQRLKSSQKNATSPSNGDKRSKSLISDEFLSNSSTSLPFKDTLSSRRTSLSTNNPLRCHRAYSSSNKTIEKETCSILGPQLCSDCLELQTRTSLSPLPLSKDHLQQRLTALALRRFLKPSEKFTDENVISMLDNEQIQLESKPSQEAQSSILTNEEYFDHLSSLLNRYAGQSSPYYFENLFDFQRKYSSNKYQRLLLSQTPAPRSSNPLFNHPTVEKFEVSPKYAKMKKASMIKPNVQSSTPIFISENQEDPFHLKYRSLKNFTPTFLLQNIQKNSTRTRIQPIRAS